MSRSITALCGALVLAGSSLAGAAGIRGDYIEARTADVYTGPCFSNAEVFIYGNQGVMAWKVTEGAFQGVDLSGLSVAAAVQGTTTFSEDEPARALAVVIVDEKADSSQREALLALARSLAGHRLDHVAAVKSARISFKVEPHAMAMGTGSTGAGNGHEAHGMPQAPAASFWVPGLASIVTRPLDERDHACGNEVVAYEPLSRGTSVLPAYTLGHSFKGQGLNSTWDDPNCRSSFVGHFAL